MSEARATDSAENPMGEGGVHLQTRGIRLSTLGTAVGTLLLLVAALEIVGRTPRLRLLLPSPSLGSPHRQIEVQWSHLEVHTMAEGPPDCFFIGSSAVYRGIRPDVFTDSFFETTGESLRCYTFGVQGLSPGFGSMIAELLASRYSPRLMVLGADTPTLAEGTGEYVEKTLRRTKWWRHQFGDPNPEGWLVEHSYAYRYVLLASNWLRKDFDRWQESSREVEEGTTALGFRGATASLAEREEQPEPMEELQAILSDFQLSTADLDGVEQFARLRGSTEVAVVEMPIHPGFLQYFKEGRSDHEAVLQAMRDRLDPLGVVYLFTSDLELIADSGWLNTNHLNRTGATEFSRWLGRALGAEQLEGNLRVPPTWDPP